MKFARIGQAVRNRHHSALRAMYTGGRGNVTARRFARLWAWVYGTGVAGRRWITLEVPGRRTGKSTRFPLGIATVDGEDHLASMLGEGCNWVRNVRANDGYAVIHRRSEQRVRLTELPARDRAALLKAYLQQVPGARPHIPVDHTAPVAEFEPIAAEYPVFRIEYLPDTP